MWLKALITTAFFFCNIYICFSQTTILRDTTLLSHSDAYKTDGVYYTEYKIPKHFIEKNEQFVLKEITNDEGSVFQSHTTEMILEDDLFIVPHECIMIKFDSLVLPHMFHKVEYRLNRLLFSENTQFDILNSCEDLKLSEQIKVQFYFKSSLLKEVFISSNATVSSEFYNYIQLCTSMELRLSSLNFKSISTPIIFILGNPDADN